MAIQATILPTGPIMLSGDLGEFQIVGADGQAFDIAGKEKVYLCRCGASTNKPFCDGTHSKIGFLAAEGAVKSGG